MSWNILGVCTHLRIFRGGTIFCALSIAANHGLYVCHSCPPHDAITDDQDSRCPHNTCLILLTLKVFSSSLWFPSNIADTDSAFVDKTLHLTWVPGYVIIAHVPIPSVFIIVHQCRAQRHPNNVQITIRINGDNCLCFPELFFMLLLALIISWRQHAQQ